MDQMLIINKSNFGTLYQKEVIPESKENTFESSRTHIYMQENTDGYKNTERMEAKDIMHLAQKFKSITHR